MSRLVPTSLLIAVVVLLGSCNGDTMPDRPPVSQEAERVESEILALPGVSGVNLEYTDEFTAGQGIDGTVEVETTTDPVQLLDDVYAIVWSLRSWQPDAIQVRLDNGSVMTDATALGATSPSATVTFLQDRYGPWPGGGPKP